MTRNKIIIAIIAIIAFIGLIGSVYVVNETEQVVVTQFGKPVGEARTTPGLKFKVPFIQNANFFEKRFLEWDGDPNQIPTKDKKYIFVDTYARWQITDPLQFFKRLTNQMGAQSRLDDILDGETRDFVANHDLIETVRTSNRQPQETGVIGEMIGDSLENIEVGREKIQSMILQAANEQTADLGIKVLDFRFKRINYVEDVRTQVYERMKSERYRIADKFRSEGEGESSRINGEKERELKNIRSTAFREAEEIMGEADGLAASVYSEAYDRSNASRSLYKFMKSMETLEKTFDDRTHFILSTDSELYRFLKSGE
ncbi:MAG: protease modulator HflC [Marinilabilia sp.]